MSWTRLTLLLLLSAPLAGFGAEPEFADVFVPKADGFASIRIPSVVVSKKGTVLAFAEGRAADADQAKNKLVLKRSTDGGKTWGKVAIIATDGDRALNNPCAVVERDSGQVLLMYQSYPAGVGERSGKIQPGYNGELIVRNWLITSDDDGVTWSKPRDLTRETKREKVVTTVAGGPGIGIQLRHGKHAGRILMPFNEGPFGVWNIYAVYSDDKGQTWQMGDVAPGGLIGSKGKPTSTVNEAQFVELKDGAIRFNVRRWAGKAVRKTCVSEDGGKTWSNVEDAPDLADPGCMGSVLRCTDPADGGKSRILFSGPQSTKRENGTVFVSYDEGKTWPTKRVLCKDSFAYSCLTALPDGTIGCLYEADGTSKIVFARFKLDWLEAKIAPAAPTPAFSIPVIDLNEQKERQVLVDREKGQYLGHPTTLLLEDNQTILCVYPKGHGRGPILYKRSEDGGKTWSERLPTPKNWETSLETPTIHRVVDAKGKKRIILFSGLYPCRMAVSEDDGKTWSELKQVGDWGGIVTMASVVELKSGAGHYLGLFHDDGRFIRKGGKFTTTSTLYKTFSTDGGLTWSNPEEIFQSNKVFLCEPGAIRSPDGKQLAVLLRENFHQKNSHIIFSNDEGKTWTEPRELAASLNGDRHVAKYGPDGRLFISFRDIPTKGEFSPTANSWVGWVGTYDDLVKGKEGQYRLHFKKNYKSGDCAYPGVELLPDGTFVVTTYGHWTPNEEPYILSVRFTLKELDGFKVKRQSAAPDVVSLGDSITRGERAGVKKEETFSALLAAKLKIAVANVGIGGERTDGALARLDRDVGAKKPKVVLVMYGTNDSYVDKGAKESRLSALRYRENLVLLVAAIRKNGAEPILMTEPRWAKGQKNGLGEDPNARLEEYVEACRAVAKEHQVPLVDHYQHWKDAEAKGAVLRDWTTDGCHPNVRGHQVLADLIEPVLKQALK